VLVEDRIYGPVRVEEPVLLDLMYSQAVQRLQGVLQHGISGLIGITAPVSRYEHSVGVMLLVQRLGAPLKEQIAALLHDVSHTAFSHVIDYVVDNHNSQSYHEEVKAEYVIRTDLPAVLARHGYDWHDFLDENGYPLLEQPAPALCADRLDYFLRDGLDLGLASLEACQEALVHLVVHDGRIVTDRVETARWLGYTYIAADDASWADFREVGLYELAARAIKHGLALGIISEADFWRTDAVVWQQLHEGAPSALLEELRLVSPQTGFAWDPDAPAFHVSTKIRTIDPDVLVDGRLQRLSAFDPDFAAHRAAYLQRKNGLWPVRVIPPEGIPGQ
jgi:HD superfamily phosphohydrolase